MRPLLLLAFALSLTAADLEYITLADGRRFVGYYDEAAGKLTVEGPPKVVLNVAAAQVASRSPYIRAEETDPVKRSAAELVRLEAEQEAAVAEAARLRKFAATRTGKEAEVAAAQAVERDAVAKQAGEKIAVIRASMPVVVAEPKGPAKTAQSKDAEAAEILQRAKEEAGRLREQATLLEFNATVRWLETRSTGPVLEPTLSADPTRSEVERHQRELAAVAMNKRLGEIYEKSKKAKDHEKREQILYLVRQVTAKEAVWRND